MAVTFLEPGGDATYTVVATNGFWASIGGTSPAIATDFVHGSHIKSIKFTPNASGNAKSPNSVCADAGTRLSFYLYINALQTGTNPFMRIVQSSNSQNINIALDATGHLYVTNANSVKLGSSVSTISTGAWHRICLAYTITSTSVNDFEFFVDTTSYLSLVNVTLQNITSSNFIMGNLSGDATLDYRISDIYVDNSNSLTDTGNIWVTAKRPNANGTTNGFTTQIGAGGSGYGSGHSQQVNERALSLTNGWSMVGAGAAVTEEYSIEGKATGDINISTATIVDFVGWVSCKSLVAETASIIVAGSSSNITTTTAAAIYTKVAGSSTYPAGNTDIGIITDTSLTTVSLYECGIMVAYIPATTTVNTGNFFHFFPLQI